MESEQYQISIHPVSHPSSFQNRSYIRCKTAQNKVEGRKGEKEKGNAEFV